VKIQIVSFICACVQEKQSVTASVYLSSAITLGPWLRLVRTSTLLVLVLALRETYALNRLSSFKNLRRKGGKFDHCRGRRGRPKVLLRHWSEQQANMSIRFSFMCSEHWSPPRVSWPEVSKHQVNIPEMCAIFLRFLRPMTPLTL